MEPSAVQEKEISQDELEDNVPAKARELLAFWNKHASGRQLPTRGDFRPGNLRAWIEDISIFEYIPEKDDFQIRIEGENIAALTGEDWRGGFARELDSQFSTSLHASMTVLRMTGKPKLHHLQVFKSDWHNAIRLLLPVLLRKPGKEDVLQVFLAIFPIEE
ncbi:PAS domain-containing protein [Thalassospira sp. HF15]|uniref:PAS domain-containing protein n=1 Tax=Thalassospira sp. HF15 TaxID=2722755 RepID=UPI001430A4E0|nr:PAS domain-containing protein [Thalassospira sp. HF15]NIY74045.1 PAS domain-containing protein [Thalassospira sp. HF15]